MEKTQYGDATAMTSAIEIARKWREDFESKYRGTTVDAEKLHALLDDSLAALLTDIRLELLRDCKRELAKLDSRALFENWLATRLVELEAERRKGERNDEMLAQVEQVGRGC
jgi:hypothetical protein